MSNLEKEVQRQIAEIKRKQAAEEAARELIRQKQAAEVAEAARLQKEAAGKVAEEAQKRRLALQLALEAEEARLLARLEAKGVEQELLKVRDELWGRRGKIVKEANKIRLEYVYKDAEHNQEIIPAIYRGVDGEGNARRVRDKETVNWYSVGTSKMSIEVEAAIDKAGKDIVSVLGKNYDNLYPTSQIPLELSSQEFRTRLEQVFVQMHVHAVISKQTPQDNEIRGRQNIREKVSFFGRLFSGNL